MSIHLGWNLIPIVITLLAIIWIAKTERESGDGMFSALALAFVLPSAGFIAALAWLIYLLCTR